MEQLANLAQTTLNGAISNTDLTLTVTSATGFPTAGDFRINIEDEIIKVTAVASNVFTVVRGQEGTTAASHADGVQVSCVLTAAAIRNVQSDYQVVGAYASLPSAGFPGRIYYPTDFTLPLVDDGSAWSSLYLGRPMTTPPQSGWTNKNLGTATVNYQGHSIELKSSRTSYETTSTHEGRGITRNLQFTSKFRVTVGFFWNHCIMYSNTNEGARAAVYFFLEDNSSNVGRMNHWLFEGNDPAVAPQALSHIYIGHMADPQATGWAANMDRNTSFNFTAPLFVQFEVDNTYCYWRLSADGVNFETQYQEAKFSYPGAYDRFGFLVRNSDQTTNFNGSAKNFSDITIFHILEEDMS